MGNDIKNILLTFDEALSICDHEFLVRHPRETWPERLATCVIRGGNLDQESRWAMSYTLVRKEPLKPGDYWAEIQGKRVLCRIDSKTGKPQVIIHRRASLPPVVLFEVLIDSHSRKVTVLADADISGLSLDDFEES